MKNLEALEANGVRILYEDNWVGEVGVDRHPEPDYSRVRSVYLGLTPKDWCAIAMHEGDSYIGGCCGTSGAIQDQVNGIFREGGYADADTFYKIGQLAKTHPDGFKEWGFLGTMSQKRFDARCARWKKLSPWKKIGLSFQAVKDKIKPYSSTVEPTILENRPDLDAKRAIEQLYGCIYMLRYGSLFRGLNDDASAQRHANDVLTLAKMLPGTRALLAQLEANFTSWSGVAIVEKARPEVITYNGLGMCLYATASDARDVVALWNNRRETNGDGVADKVILRPVTISVQKGVEFNDKEQPA
jgi:hypothetical protein